MPPLRQRMIEDLRIRGLAQSTIDSYVGAVERLARYFHRSPVEFDREHIRAFQVHLVCERHLSTTTLNYCTSALRFLYTILFRAASERFAAVSDIRRRVRNFVQPHRPTKQTTTGAALSGPPPAPSHQRARDALLSISPSQPAHQSPGSRSRRGCRSRYAPHRRPSARSSGPSTGPRRSASQ